MVIDFLMHLLLHLCDVTTFQGPIEPRFNQTILAMFKVCECFNCIITEVFFLPNQSVSTYVFSMTGERPVIPAICDVPGDQQIDFDRRCGQLGQLGRGDDRRQV